MPAHAVDTMPIGSIGSETDLLRRIGPLGLAKTLYHSRRVEGGPLALVTDRHSDINIAADASVSLSNHLFIGAIAPGAPNAVKTTTFTVARGGTVRAGDGVPRLSPGAAAVVEGEFRIGDSFINCGARILCGERIEIGDGCAIGWDVTIADDDRHQLAVGGEDRPQAAPIIVEDDVWIGHNASLTKGVRVGEGAVIASGATVTKDVPPGSVVAGTSADVLAESCSWD